ncbi:MAG: SsrA-binding protein, partial [Deltaproteobacteria bacterium]|nr:SsrA-binding protein [Deltaproteobacteria bacterium]
MHKREILKLGIKIDQDRFALVPLKMYFKGGKVKIQLGLGKGKKLHDKREDIKQKDIERSLRQKYKL